MKEQRIVARRWLRVGVQATIAAAGVAAIVGSVGVGAGWPTWPPSPCPPEICQNFVTVDLEPRRATAQLGQNVVFTAIAYKSQPSLPDPTYAWCRILPGGSACAPIADATGASLTATNVNLTDDQARYRVRVQSGTATATSNDALLMVSTAPPVVYADGDFAPGAWASSGFEGYSPRAPSSAFAVARPADGGNPGAYLSVTYGPLAAGAPMAVAHAAQAATYDPSQLGAIYSVDFRAECKPLAGYGGRMYVRPMLRQGARTYVAGLLFQQSCESSGWAFDAGRGSVVASDFEIFDGPACGGGESCPDFAAAGMPITFGVLSGNELVDAAATAAHGIDNWRVSVWRR